MPMTEADVHEAARTGLSTEAIERAFLDDLIYGTMEGARDLA